MSEKLLTRQDCENIKRLVAKVNAPADEQHEAEVVRVL